ncbi:AIPR family protein [Solibacillus sp. NPDC093137]|uniref:AIPR family protein n=1 Tax=Solibacillus sp. NPDC093137 TaxID=3390678 RepID=UPI003D04F9B8
MHTLEEFYQDFIQTIYADASSRGILKQQSFFEQVCEDLVSLGILSVNYTEADHYFPKTRKPTEAHGYDYDEERKILSIVVHQFYQEDNIQTLTLANIDSKFKRVQIFLEKCYEGFYKELENTSQAYDMAYLIYQHLLKQDVDKIRLILLTDGKITKSFKGFDSQKFENLEVEKMIVDIEFLYRNYQSQAADSSFEVELNLPALKIPANSEKYQAYLTFLNGNQLVDIYEEFGQRLLEQNVRTFLQFKGSINKGIRNTIQAHPDLFFAYNNGITATAAKVDTDEKGNIKKIYNLQIVNGGQTTSAIYAAKKNSKLDVSKLSVQMKLSVIENEESYGDFVGRVAEYANTQNKVNKSDFFSNSPFHKEIKTYSSKIWVPSKDGTQKMTRWYYERVRGEYLNNQAYLTKAKQSEFQKQNPKKQMFDKTFLSKSENTWLQKPDIVSKGAQYSFAEFAKYITDLLEKDNMAITDTYYKDAIARIILFRKTEEIIQNAYWYNGGYRAQAVTYTISYLSWYVSKIKKYFNFNLIWELQDVDPKLRDLIENLAEQIYNYLTNPPKSQGNVTQWCKKLECWDNLKLKEIELNLPPKYLLNSQEIQYVKKEAKDLKKMDSGIGIQLFVAEMPQQTKELMLDYFSVKENRKTISLTKFDILSKFTKGKLPVVPSEKQCKLIYDMYSQAFEEGYAFD